MLCWSRWIEVKAQSGVSLLDMVTAMNATLLMPDAKCDRHDLIMKGSLFTLASFFVAPKSKLLAKFASWSSMYYLAQSQAKHGQDPAPEREKSAIDDILDSVGLDNMKYCTQSLENFAFLDISQEEGPNLIFPQ